MQTNPAPARSLIRSKMRYLTTCAAVLVLTGLSVAAPAAEPVEVEGVDLDSDAQSASRFKYYTMPTSASGPCDITTGPDGNIWVQDFLVNKIARINVETNKITEFDIPYTKLPLNIPLPGQAPGRSGLTACAIQPGKDGNLYAATGVRNQFLKIDLSKATPKIKVFDTGDPTTNPTGNLQPFNDLWRGDEGVCCP